MGKLSQGSGLSGNAVLVTVAFLNHRPLEKPGTFAGNYHVNLLRWKVSIALESFHRFHNFMPSRPMGSSLGFQCPFRWVFNVLFAEF